MTATLIVEDGSYVLSGYPNNQLNAAVPGANTYISVAYLTGYCSDRGITLSNDPTQLILRAMDYMESLSYIGYKYTQAQTLQWPRADIWVDGWYTPIYQIPWQLQVGQCAVCIAIDEGNGPLIDIPRATLIERVGSVMVQYTPGATPLPLLRNISAQLYKVLDEGQGRMFAVRKS